MGLCQHGQGHTYLQLIDQPINALLIQQPHRRVILTKIATLATQLSNSTILNSGTTHTKNTITNTTQTTYITT